MDQTQSKVLAAIQSLEACMAEKDQLVKSLIQLKDEEIAQLRLRIAALEAVAVTVSKKEKAQ